MKRALFSVGLAALLCGPAQAQLVIAGGGLSSDTQDVWQAFIDQAKSDGDFVIVPSASGSPALSAASVRDTLIRYGVTADRISVAPLAVRDDRTTDDVDEAKWKANAKSDRVAEQLRSASAIWFTGGDQSRTTALLNPKGKDSTALTAIREAHAAGTVIGGTSAGAAIMSEVMILQGDSLPTLIGSKQGERLKLGDGLGFLEYGLVDQHFGERARLGRLAVALAQQSDPHNRIGFGIDEDTALIERADGSLSVAGSGYVTILDARAATAKRVKGQAQISGLSLHMAAAGDGIDPDTLTLTPADWKSATVGDEYVRSAAPAGGGMAVPGQMLQDVVGNGLVDNAQSQTVERISFDGKGRGVGFVFTQDKTSEGYWGRGPDGAGRYTIANVRFDIVPVALTLDTLK